MKISFKRPMISGMSLQLDKKEKRKLSISFMKGKKKLLIPVKKKKKRQINKNKKKSKQATKNIRLIKMLQLNIHLSNRLNCQTDQIVTAYKKTSNKTSI
jgi:hypothetical protein